MNNMNLASMTKESVLNDIETSKKKLEESITKAKSIIKQHGMDAWKTSVIDASQIQRDNLRDVYMYLENVAKIEKAIAQGMAVSDDDIKIISSLDKSATNQIQQIKNVKLTNELKELITFSVDNLFEYILNNDELKEYEILPIMEDGIIYFVKTIILFNPEAGNFLKDAYSKYINV